MKNTSVGGSKPLYLRLLTGGAVLAMSIAILPATAQAAGTAAGTVITNTATAEYDNGSGTTTTTPSNPVNLTVDELLDVTVASTDPADVSTTPGSTADELTFTVTNNGNGSEAFTLGTIANNAGDDYDPTAVKIYIDNGDNIFDPATDTLYIPGTNDPVLNPDQTIKVFVVGTTPGNVADGDRAQVVLTAESNTVLANGNNNTPGTTIAGAGTGGSNAVVGATGADGEDDGFYQVSAATVTLVKSAVVTDQFGGSQPVPGATIRYTIVATVTGSGSVNSLVVSDPAPAGTTYKPATITLGGTAQTDAADTDAGRFASNTVTVNAGTVAGGQTRTVTFDVTIN